MVGVTRLSMTLIVIFFCNDPALNSPVEYHYLKSDNVQNTCTETVEN